jgi:hypothetical protein
LISEQVAAKHYVERILRPCLPLGRSAPTLGAVAIRTVPRSSGRPVVRCDPKPDEMRGELGAGQPFGITPVADFVEIMWRIYSGISAERRKKRELSSRSSIRRSSSRSHVGLSEPLPEPRESACT